MTHTPRALWQVPTVLSPAAPAGAAADTALGLRWYVVRDGLAPDEDPFGVGVPSGADEREGSDLMLRFYAWVRQQSYMLGKENTATQAAEEFHGFLYDENLSVYSCTECDLRRFLYDHLPRNRRGAAHRPAGVVLEGLAWFVNFLDRYEQVRYPWAGPLLGDAVTFDIRCATLPAGRLDDPSVIAWRRDLHDDLSARVFLPDPGIAGGGKWRVDGIAPLQEGENEYALDLLYDVYDELSRRWLVWREEVIASGIADPGRVRAVLIRRQREWETHSHPGLDGRTPAEAVLKARQG